MTKVRGPLFSIDAKGSLNKTITYKKGVFGKVVRNWRKPKATSTAAQINIRTWFQRGIWTWQGKSGDHGYYFSYRGYGLEEPARADWRLYRTVKSLFGYYAFMKRWLQKSLSGKPQYQVPPHFGFCVADEWFCDNLYANGRFNDWTSPLQEWSTYVADIKALWHMNEAKWDGTEGEVKDSSIAGGYGINAGKKVGTAGLGKDGKYNNCGKFVGGEGYIEIPNDESIKPTGDFSILFWVKLDTKTPSSDTPTMWSGERMYSVWIIHNVILKYMQITVTREQPSTAIVLQASEDYLTVGVYNQIALTYKYNFDGTNTKGIMYIDGVERASDIELIVPIRTHATNSNYIGGINHPNYGVEGNIDEFAYVGRCIGPAEILNIYNRNLPLRAEP